MPSIVFLHPSFLYKYNLMQLKYFIKFFSFSFFLISTCEFASGDRLSRSAWFCVLVAKYSWKILKWHVWLHVCYYIDPIFIEFLVHFSLFWHRVRFFLFSSINIITIRYKNTQKESKANVSATYGGPLQCHKFKD